MNRTIIVLGALLVGMGCGSSSSSPTPPTPTAPGISSVTGTTLSASGATSSATIATTGTTSVSGAASSQGAITVTFDTTMDGSTMSNATLACGGTAQTITISPTTNTTAYTFTPSPALPQLSSCILTLPATITNASGTALAAITYTYTTGCSTNDDFSTDSLSTCWSSGNSPTATVANNALNLSSTIDTGFLLVGNYKTFGSEDITVTIAIPTFSGITSTSDSCGIVIVDGSNEEVGLLFLLQTQGSNLDAYVNNIAGSDPESHSQLAASGSSNAALAGTLWYKVTQTGSTFVTSYRIGDSGDFTTASTNSVTLGSTKKVELIVKSDGSGTVNCQYSDFTVTGATATGPTYAY